MVGISKELTRNHLLRDPVGLINLLGKFKLPSLPPYTYACICLDLFLMKDLLISGSFNFFSTSQSKQQKNNSNGPKGKTPPEDEGK